MSPSRYYNPVQLICLWSSHVGQYTYMLRQTSSAQDVDQPACGCAHKCAPNPHNPMFVSSNTYATSLFKTCFGCTSVPVNNMRSRPTKSTHATTTTITLKMLKACGASRRPDRIVDDCNVALENTIVTDVNPAELA
jgi:hypothetical protein